MDLNLKTYLKKHNISYSIYEHPAVFTVAESEKVTKHIPGVRSKNLFLKDENNKYYLICMPGEKRLNTKKIKSHFQIKELNFASPAELKEQLNITPGSVSIFSMIYAKSNIKLIIDKAIWNAEQGGFHPNINTSTLVINRENLKRFLNTLDCEKEVLDCE